MVVVLKMGRGSKSTYVFYIFGVAFGQMLLLRLIQIDLEQAAHGFHKRHALLAREPALLQLAHKRVRIEVMHMERRRHRRSAFSILRVRGRVGPIPGR